MRSFELANALRSTESRSKRALLDEAADCIQVMDVRIGMLEEENKLLRAKTEALESAKDAKEMYEKAIKAMGVYNGLGEDEDYADI